MRVLLACAALLASAAPAAAAGTGCKLQNVLELPVTMDGPRPVVLTRINGVDARLFVDTGAAFSMLDEDALKKFGMRERGHTIVEGVTGSTTMGVATAETLGITSRPLRQLDFLIAGGHEAASDGVLGQNILGGLDEEFDLANGVIRLWRTEGCEHAFLAYWDKAQTAAILPMARQVDLDRRIRTTASVNGQKMRVMMDTGAPRSMLTLHGAERAGVTRETPGVTPAGRTSGVSGRAVDTWIAPFDSFALGTEEIRHTRLRVADLELAGSEMLLGADFFLSHRVYVARSQGQILITYNGGPVFRLDQAAAPAATAGQPAQAAQAGDAYSDQPKDAAGFARRAAASMSRGRFSEAAADFGKAMELEPDHPEHALHRAQAHLRAREPQLARDDLDRVIKLRPDDVEALELRGALRLGAKDLAGARADFAAAAAKDPDSRLESAAQLTSAAQYPDALALLDAWLAANPKSALRAEGLNSRCWTRAVGGFDLDKALQDCDAAVKLSPRSAQMLDSRGLVQLRLGRYDAAIVDYDAALKREPRIAWSLYGRGLAKRRKGLGAEADADLKAAVQIAPDLPEQARRIGLAP